METLLLNEARIEEATPMNPLIETLRDAFVAYALGDAQMPSKSYIELPKHNGDFRSMPAYVDTGEWEGAGMKWVNVHPSNTEHPTVMATAIYSDPSTGFPLALLNGTELTARRTGGVAGLATDELAVQDATSLGIIGAGAQSYLQADAVRAVRPIEDIYVVDRNEKRVNDFIAEHKEESVNVTEGTVPEAAQADVLCTVTPSKSPIVSRDDVGETTHINAMGADAAGKQELDPQILKDAKVVIDDWEQATHSGEVNVPFSEGLLDDSNIHATLGEVAARMQSGREDVDGITVFDSTGLAIQDVAAAHLAYEVQKDAENVPTLDLV